MSLKTYINSHRKRLRKRKRLIAFLSILAILGLSSATYAWFTVNTFAGVQDFELEISMGEELRVSMENHGSDIDKYVHVITNDMVNSYLRDYDTSIDDMLLSPVTTSEGTKFTYQYGQPVKENERGTYLEFKSWFIASRDMYVHLTTEGIDDEEHDFVDGTKVTTTSPAPQSDVIRSLRVSFDSGDSYKTYEPNKGASESTALKTFDLPKGEMNYNNSNQLFFLEKLTPKQVTLRFWLEGEDPECDDDIQRANVKVQLSFLGCDENGNPIS